MHAIPAPIPVDNETDNDEEALLSLLEALKKLERKFKLGTRFNLFDAVGMARQEIRHSRFLTYLLDPRNPHGLGDSFLRALVTAAVTEHPEPPVTRLNVAVADFTGCAVHCERDHFDITVEVPSLRLLFVIENKIDAAESHEQLQKYRSLALSRYQNHRFMGSFLTPDGYEGQDDNWGVMSYTTVIAELKLVLESNSVSQDVALIISHYVELIERKIVPSQALIDACKSIYQQHRAAVDLIVQHGQEPQLSQAFEQFTRAGNRALKTTAIRSSTVHFLFESWLHIDNYPHADRKRWSSEFPVLFWFEVGSKQLYLRLEVGPFLEVTLRSPIVNRLQAKLKEKEPKQGGKGNGETYTRIITYKTSISEDPTVDELVGAMEKTWKDASQHDLEQTIRAVLTHSAS